MTERRGPNLLFVFSDEHRRHALPWTGCPELPMPTFERLRREGAEFTHAVSNYAVCSPYRAMLMSGRWPYRQGVIDNGIPLSPEGPSLGRAFKQAGYRTGYIGKWHLGGKRAEPFGFDTSLIWTLTGSHFDSQFHPAGGDPVSCNRYNAEAMTGQAIEFVDQNPNEPWMLMLSIDPPHSSFTDAPERFKAMVPQDRLPLPPNMKEIDLPEEMRTGFSVFEYTDELYQGYLAHVLAVDERLGRLVDHLDEAGLGGDTVVIYTSDHGTQMGSQGVASKREPFEESIRVPFLVRCPGTVPAGRSVDALMGAIDLMPTLCGLAGIDAPEGCCGVDLSSWFAGGEGPRPESQFIMHIAKDGAARGKLHPAPIFRGVTTGKYTYAVKPEGPWCLFDNEADPYQLNNLVDDPSCKAVRRRLHAMTAQWLIEAEDPFELKD